MMINIVTCTILCMFAVCATAVDKSVEYKRTGSCDFAEECMYKYTATQHNYGEEDREEIELSADVNWHCDSSGSFGSQSAKEFCFTIYSASIRISVANDTMNYTSDDLQQLLVDELQGEFCYVQSSDGKIVSVHYGTTENHEAINIKRSIASTFQANFKSEEGDVEESDAGSIHTSHYIFDKESDDVKFTRKVGTGDLIKMAGQVPQNSLVYDKVEESTFTGSILQESHGAMKIKIDFGSAANEDDNNYYDDSSTYDNTTDFGNQFQSNGTYTIEKVSCQKRSKRDVVFADLTASDIERGNLLAVIDIAKFGQSRIRKIRDTIPSVAGLFERLHKNPTDPELANIVNSFRELLALEVKYGTPSHHTPAIDQLIEYYKKITLSDKPKSMEMRKLIYSFLAIDGSLRSQQILGSLLTKSMGEDERGILLHQLAQISNAGPELVDTVININPSNDDGLLLVLGALARNNDHTIQNVVVGELLRRLDTVKSSTNNTELIILLNYALGNTGSKLAIDALLSSLDHDDIDTQISVIRGLGVHLVQPKVQNALIILLNGTEEDKVLEEALVILKDACNDKILVNPNEDLLDTIVKTAVKLENPNLYELLIQYLTLVGTDRAQQHINTLRRQHNYGQVVHDQASRIKRGSDWDESNSNYDTVVSYSERRNDVRDYPSHLAYIWGKSLGTSKMEMKIGAGAFAGSYWTDSNKRLKFFSKFKIKGDVLGRTFDLVDIEFAYRTSNSTLFIKKYWKILGLDVYLNIDKSIDLAFCLQSVKIPLWSGSGQTAFNYRKGYYVYISTIYFYLRGILSGSAGANLCFSPLEMLGCLDMKASVTLQVNGGGSASLLSTIRGGIDVRARLGYYLEPSACVQGSLVDKTKPFEACLSLYHGYPYSYIYIEPWYQSKTITFEGGGWLSIPKPRIRWSGTISWGEYGWSTSSPRSLLVKKCIKPDLAKLAQKLTG